MLTANQAEYRAAFQHKLDDGRYSLESVPCPCGAGADVPLAHCDRFGLPVGVVLCTACGLARTRPRLAASNLGEFYEQEYHGLHFGVRDPDPDMALFRVGQGAAIHALLRDLLPARPIRVADVGSGTGQVLREFAVAAEHPVTGVGCEYSAAFVEAGRRAGSDIRHGGAEALAGEQSFDLVILSHVVEHFADPVTDLAPVRALGHEGALFYVEVPGLLTIDQKPEYAYTLEQYLTLAHTFHFTLDTLTATMNRAGFGNVRGDEQVRSVFLQASAANPRPDREQAARILVSLRALDSWPMRVKRTLLRLRKRTGKLMYPMTFADALSTTLGFLSFALLMIGVFVWVMVNA